jgi:polyhydroxyalkanoate synthesis regulator phasin
MATRRKRTRVSKAAPLKFEGFADLLSKLEVEAEKVVRRFIDKAEHSSRELKKGISALIEQVRTEGLATVASEKKDDLIRLAEDVINRAKEIQFLPLGSFNRDEIIREAKKNLDELISRINSSEILARAKVTAVNTKNQVLSILSIPSQSEVVKLSRKITSLESRVNKLTRKAA